MSGMIVTIIIVMIATLSFVVIVLDIFFIVAYHMIVDSVGILLLISIMIIAMKRDM